MTHSIKTQGHGEQSRTMANFYKKGLTAVELLVALSIFGMIIAIVFPQFSKIRENQVLQNGIVDTLLAVNKARSQTLSSLNSSEYGVHFESNKVIMFKGKVFSAGAVDNEITNIVIPASISNVNIGGVSSTSGDIYFNRISGFANNVSTITISSPSYSKIITIFATGLAEFN